jgi:CubicO group peptidase (beta-lactamase class C family)
MGRVRRMSSALTLSRRSVLVAGLGIVALVLLLTTPRPTPAAGDAVDTQLMRSIFGEMAEGGRFSGTVVASKDGRIVFRADVGLADRARGIRISERTQYRFNSLTSIFTAVGLAQLQDRRALRVDASICRYVPRCPRSWRPITVEMLFGPATGLRRLSFQTPPTVAEYVEALRREPLHVAPGTKWPRANPKLSSGDSQSILAVYILERVARQAWLPYMRRHILRPAGMTATELDVGRPSARAIGYVRDGRGRAVPAPNTSFRSTVNPDALAGLRGTALDFMRFENALNAGKLVSADGLELLSRIALPVERRRGIGWSCCWLVGRTAEGEPVHMHGAHSLLPDGFYSGFHRYPTAKVFVVFFTNFGGNGPVWSGLETLGLIARGMYPRAVALDGAALGEYVADYVGIARTVRGRRLEAPRIGIAASAPGLTARALGTSWIANEWFSSRVRLRPLGGDEFFDRLQPNQRFRFTRDASGNVDGLVLTNVNYPNWHVQLRRTGDTRGRHVSVGVTGGGSSASVS